MTVALTDGSGVIDAADASQEIFEGNGDRAFLLVQNLSDTDMWLNFGEDAEEDTPGSYLIPANGGSIELKGDECPEESVHILCSADAKKFTAKEGV